MAGNQQLLELLIKAKADVAAAFREVEQGLKDTGNATEEAKNKMGGFSAFMNSSVGDIQVKYLALAATVKGAVGFINDSLKAQAAQEGAINKLNLALANQGKFTAETSKSLVDFSASLQDVSTYADDVILSGEAMLASFGMTEEQIKKTTQTALDFAAATGTDLTSAFDLLGKAYAGNTAALGRYGIVLDESLPKSQKFEAAVSQLDARFSGSALAATKTYTGQMEQLGNAYGDVQEAVGKFFGELTGGGAAIEQMTGLMKSLANVISQDLVIVLGELRAKFSESLGAIADIAASGLEAFGFTEMAKTFNDFAIAQDKVADDFRNSSDQAAAAAGKTQEYANAANAAGKADLDRAAKLKAAEKAQKEYTEALTKGMEAFFNERHAILEAKQSFDELGASQQDLTIEMGRLSSQVERFGGVSELSDAQLRDVIETLEALKAGGGDNAWGIETLNAALEEAAKRGVMAGNALKQFEAVTSGMKFWSRDPEIQKELEANGGKLFGEAAKTIGQTMKEELSKSLKSLPQVIMGAIQGGGNVGGAIGAHLGGTLAKGLEKPLSGALSGVLGKTLGAGLGSLVPGLGTLFGGALGGFLGKGLGKVFGGIFGGGEGGKVKDMRKQFIEAAGGIDELKRKAAEAGVSLDKMFSATKIKDFENAVKGINGAFSLQQQSQEALNAAVEKYGFTVDELGPKWKQQELDKQAASLLQEYELLTASGINHNTVISRMGPALNEYVQTAMAAGIAIPENMRPALEKMLEMGQLTDEAGNKMTSLDGLSFTESLTDGLRSAVDAIRDLVAALTGIPRETNVNVNVRTNRSGGESYGGDNGGYGGEKGMDGIESNAFGGISTGPSLRMTHGSPSNPEIIAPVREMSESIGAGLAQQLMAQGMVPGSGGAPAAAGGMPPIFIQIGPQAIDDFIARRMENGYIPRR